MIISVVVCEAAGYWSQLEITVFTTSNATSVVRAANATAADLDQHSIKVLCWDEVIAISLARLADFVHPCVQIKKLASLPIERVGVQVKLRDPLRTRAGTGPMSASEIVIHEEALCQMYVPLPYLYRLKKRYPLLLSSWKVLVFEDDPGGSLTLHHTSFCV